jgi:hypothetical protein
MSVYLAPSLVADAGTKVAQFPLFNSWPSTAAGILFQVSFDGGQSWSDPLSAVYDENDKLDAALWTAIFGGDVAVGEHAPVTLDQGLESYDADTWYQTLHHIYIPDPSELLPSRGGNKLVPVAARLLPSADIVTQEQRAYGQFLNFHRPRSNAPLQPLADATNVPNSDALDFHTAVSALSRYPAAMRALGLVFDLELPLPTDLPLAGLAGIVRVRPVSNAFLPDWQIIYPTTVYSLDVAKDLFTLRTALNDNQHQLASGMLFSAGATLIPIDLDALGLAAHNAMNGASQAAQSTPTPRNAGISLTLPGLAKRLQDQIDSGNNVWSQISQNNDPSNHGDDVRPLFAEDLIRGYRVDVRTVEQNQWHSLCRRRVTFDFGSSQRHWDEDEGLIGLIII